MDAGLYNSIRMYVAMLNSGLPAIASVALSHDQMQLER